MNGSQPQPRIVLIEDDKHNRELILEMLRDIGLTNVFPASTGRLGLSLTLGQPTQMVICDYHLTDGLTAEEISAQIRSSCLSKAVVRPLIVVISADFDGPWQPFADCFFSKPILHRFFLSAIKKMLASVA